MNIHFLFHQSASWFLQCYMCRYHLECVQLLLDLLGQQGRKAVARGDLAAPVVFATGPGIVEGDARAEANIELRVRAGGCGSTVGVDIELRRCHEVIILLVRVFNRLGFVGIRSLVFGPGNDGNLWELGSRWKCVSGLGNRGERASACDFCQSSNSAKGCKNINTRLRIPFTEPITSARSCSPPTTLLL